MGHEAFRSGHFDTHFVEKYFDPRYLDQSCDEEQMIAAWFVSRLFHEKSHNNLENRSFKKSKWKQNRI